MHAQREGLNEGLEGSIMHILHRVALKKKGERSRVAFARFCIGGALSKPPPRFAIYSPWARDLIVMAELILASGAVVQSET
jgi:hypothetical protein